MDLQSIRHIISLLKKFDDVTLTPMEFLDLIIKEQFVSKYIMKWFITLTNNMLFIDMVLDNFYKTYMLSPRNKYLLKVQLFLLIFEMNENNLETIKTAFNSLKYITSFYLPHYLINEVNLINIAQIGVSVFENDYVTENIIKPLLTNQNLFCEICCYLYNDYSKSRKQTREPQIKPDRSNVDSNEQPKTSVLTKEVEGVDKFKVTVKPVPLTTYYQDRHLEKKILKVKMKNREKALELFVMAQRQVFRCASGVKKKLPDFVIEPRVTYRKPAPILKTVAVKDTTATLLRAAAQLCKTNTEELNRVKNITTGGVDEDRYTMLEDEVRQEKELEHLKDIERKHLYGLLSYEDAKLARKKYLESKRHENEDFKLQRDELRRQLEEARKDDLDKFKAVVQKCKDIEQSVKVAEGKLLEEKQRNVKLINYESQQLKEQVEAKQAEEFIQKRKVIEEIKVLEHLRMDTVKEFDQTETVNLGLMCEMSLAELKERLALMKVDLQEELEERQQKILNEKCRKQELLDSVKNFIAEARQDKILIKKEITQKSVIVKPKLCFKQSTHDDELNTLRERLFKSRKLNT